MLVKQRRFPVRHILTIGLLPSFLKVIVYRLKGYEIDKDVSIGFGSVVIGQKVRIGKGTKIGFLAVVRCNEVNIGRFVSIGSMTVIYVNRLVIGDDSRINEQVYVGGQLLPESELVLGKRVIIMQLSFINPTKPIHIGDDTGIGGHCLLFTHGSWQPVIDGFPVLFAPITLGRNVWLPWRVFVMPGVTVGDNTTIGADSLITKDLPPNSLAVGSPAKVVKSAPEYPRRLQSEEQEVIIRRINEELLAYLRFFGYSGEHTSIGPNDKYLLCKSTNRYAYYYISHGSSLSAVLEEIDFNTKDVFILSFPELTEKESQYCHDQGIMWADLTRRLRGGSNNIGEEVVKYFSRHGIRFDRTD